MPNLEQISVNIKKIKDANLPFSEAERYMKKEGVTFDQVKQYNVQKNKQLVNQPVGLPEPTTPQQPQPTQPVQPQVQPPQPIPQPQVSQDEVSGKKGFKEGFLSAEIPTPFGTFNPASAVGAIKQFGRGSAASAISMPSNFRSAYGSEVALKSERLKAIMSKEKLSDFDRRKATNLLMGQFTKSGKLTTIMSEDKIREVATQEIAGFDKSIARVEELNKKTQDKIVNLGLARTEEDGTLYDLGSGATTVLASVFGSMATRSPGFIGIMFGVLQKGAIADEMKKKGFSEEKISAVSTLAGIFEGGLEFAGIKGIYRAAKKSKFLNRLIAGATTEAPQEASQSWAEALVTEVTGVRDEKLENIVIDGLYSALLGGILGGGTSAIVGSIQDYGSKNNIPQELIDKIIDTATNDKVNKEFTNVIKNLNVKQIKKEIDAVGKPQEQITKELKEKPAEQVVEKPIEKAVEKPLPPTQKETQAVKKVEQVKEVKPVPTKPIEPKIKDVEISKRIKAYESEHTWDFQKTQQKKSSEIIPEQAFKIEMLKGESKIVDPQITKQYKDFLKTNPSKGKQDTFLSQLHQDVVADNVKKSNEQVSKSFEKQKDIWIGNKDVDILKSKVDVKRQQNDIKSITKEKGFKENSKKLDTAIQIAMDSKRNPGHIKEFYNKLTKEQKEIVDMSQNLPKEAQSLVSEIDAQYKKIGKEAVDAGVIRNVLDNYASRVWDKSSKVADTPINMFGEFSTSTRHAKHRKLDTIVQGWSRGMKLKVSGATNNLQVLREEITKTIEDRNFLNALKTLKNVKGDNIITNEHQEGYVKIKHPNFKNWVFAGKAEPGSVFGKNLFVDNKGNLFKKESLYAPQKIAKNLNNILGVSAIKDVPGVKTITKYNALIKDWILQTSLFHRIAFTRSYYLGTSHKQFNEMKAFGKNSAYKQGLKSIEGMDDIIRFGVRKGLTLGLKQDWDESLVREKTIIGEILDKNKVTKEVKDKIMAFRDAQADFLFDKLGAGLKAKAFIIEFKNQLKKHPNDDIGEVAKRVASLINDDFGGLHLQRIGKYGRNQTLQHFFRLFALAPDWTESNVRTMIKSVKKGGIHERAMYQKFWAGIMTKSILLTLAGNVLMSMFDEDDFWTRYRKAWEDGNLRWLDINITPLYRALGGKSTNRKYFSILGHFRDPIKFITHPIRSAIHKGSIVFNSGRRALTGKDWRGRTFTTFPELVKTGKTVEYSFNKSGNIGYSQLLSYLINTAKATQPVQIQNLLAWTAGEMEGFDAVLNSAGLGIGTGRDKEPKPSKTKKFAPTFGSKSKKFSKKF